MGMDEINARPHQLAEAQEMVSSWKPFEFGGFSSGTGKDLDPARKAQAIESMRRFIDVVDMDTSTPETRAIALAVLDEVIVHAAGLCRDLREAGYAPLSDGSSGTA